MVNRRPTPERLATLKIEIDQRYRRQAREAASRQPERRSRGMAAIRLAELTRWLDDTFGKGVELQPSTASYAIVRIFAHHLGTLKAADRRIMGWINMYAPWISLRDRERLITEVSECSMKWSADKLAWKLRLTDAKRTELRIKTIGAIDCNKEQRLARRRQLRAIRDKARNQAKKAKRSPSI